MAHIHEISPQTLLKWLESDEVVLIDVREPVEFQSESIEQAENLPLSQVTIDEAHLPEHSGKKVILYCQSGRRSNMACEKLKNDGATFDIWDLEGGLTAWKEYGLPVKTLGKKILPLDRQVQITVGSIILTGMALGYWLNPLWFVLPVIAGLGLLNAGISGWCGMAKVIVRMPWNRK